jgi:hypothetical protein
LHLPLCLRASLSYHVLKSQHSLQCFGTNIVYYYWNLQFLNSAILFLSKLSFSYPKHRWPLSILAILFMLFGFITQKHLLNSCAFQYFNFVCTWWRLFQKSVLRFKCDIYLLIYQFFFGSGLSLIVSISSGVSIGPGEILRIK